MHVYNRQLSVSVWTLVLAAIYFTTYNILRLYKFLSQLLEAPNE